MTKVLTTVKVSQPTLTEIGRWIPAVLMLLFVALIVAATIQAPLQERPSLDRAVTIIDWHGNSGRMAP